MIKRIIEIVVGIVIAICLFAGYSDQTHEYKLIIWHILSPKTLQVVIWIPLFFLAGRLIFGKYNDYSHFFYKLIEKILGDPKKTGNND